MRAKNKSIAFPADSQLCILPPNIVFSKISSFLLFRLSPIYMYVLSMRNKLMQNE